MEDKRFGARSIHFSLFSVLFLTLLALRVFVLSSHSLFVFVCVSPKEFLSDREHGQARLSTVGASGELLMAVVSKDRVEGIKAKVSNARDDWKSLMTNLQMREDALKVCYIIFVWMLLLR